MMGTLGTEEGDTEEEKKRKPQRKARTDGSDGSNTVIAAMKIEDKHRANFE